jgi:hypothetical protein
MYINISFLRSLEMAKQKPVQKEVYEMEAGKVKQTYAEKNRERTKIIMDFITVLQKAGYDPEEVKGYSFGEMKAITKFLATHGKK